MTDQQIRDNIRRRLYLKAGIPAWDGDENKIKNSVLSRLVPFVVLMFNRLVMGHMRYGELEHPDKPTHDHLASIRSRLDKWEIDGNDEHLVDIANLCFCEYLEGKHPRKHFSAADDSEHAKTK
jgi:hypothetical protein